MRRMFLIIQSRCFFKPGISVYPYARQMSKLSWFASVILLNFKVIRLQCSGHTECTISISTCIGLSFFSEMETDAKIVNCYELTVIVHAVSYCE